MEVRASLKIAFASAVVSAVAVASAGVATAQDFSVSKEEHHTPATPYSPYVNDYYAQNAYFGDTYLNRAYTSPIWYTPEG